MFSSHAFDKSVMVFEKVARRLNSVVKQIRTGISSYIGVRIVIGQAVDKELEAWRNDFTGSRILVVGTGPSLECISEEYFANFDVLICINHAILCVPKHHCIYYVSTDLPRTAQVMESAAAEKVLMLPRERRVLLLSFVLAAPHLLGRLLRNFILVKFSSYRFHRWGGGNYYQPSAATDEEVCAWLRGDGGLDKIPARGGSSAFSALLLAARYRPAEIRLIGVDLNEERSSSLRKMAGPAVFGGNWARERFSRLERLIRGAGTKVTNDSWKIKARN